MIRLAHFVTHPIQYFVPLYRQLARRDDLKLTVFFGSHFGTQPSFDEGFGKTVQFDVPMLDGYDHEFVENRGSGIPSAGRDNFDCPGLNARLNSGQFDALWVHGWGYKAQRQAVEAVRRSGIPYVIRGETTLIDAPRYSPRWFARKWRFGGLVGSAAGCLYIGKANREFYRSLGVPDERLFPAHYAINAEQFGRPAFSPDLRHKIRSRSGAGENTFVFATLAKVIARKRIVDVLRAVSAIGPECHLWVLGDGADRVRLEALGSAIAPGQIHWLGFVNQSEIPEVLAAADGFVLASDDEPWGLAVNEAMACALPVIVSDRVGCAPDLVVDGATGHVFRSGDVAELTRKLQLLIADRDQARKMGEAGRNQVLSHYDVKTTSQQIAAALHAILI